MESHESHEEIGGNDMKTRILSMAASLCVFFLLVALSNGVPTAKAATDEQIEQAITDGLEWLAQQQNPDGDFGGCVVLIAFLSWLKFPDYFKQAKKFSIYFEQKEEVALLQLIYRGFLRHEQESLNN